MELLLPMAAKKLDLSYNIDRDVPPCKRSYVYSLPSKNTLISYFRGASRLHSHPPRYVIRM